MNAHAQTRFLTARKLLLSYFEASKMIVEAHSGDKGGTIVSAPCQPDLCLVTNQTLDFSIVIPPNPLLQDKARTQHTKDPKFKMRP